MRGFNMNAISQHLIQWFQENKRSLPWREERDWYKILLSEFLLQQTQVSQALPYFQVFIRRFPTIRHLAKADEDEVLQLWAGLGYYSRARNLLKAARQIVERFDGLFPEDLKTAQELPGIGPYTAAAILSMAFNKPTAVVDGNVLRVVTRLFAIPQDIRLTKTQTEVRKIVQQLLPADQPGLFNEALMELGALICKPIEPQCTQCPLQTFCLSFKQNLTSTIPFKSAARPKRQSFQVVFVARNSQNQLLLAQRQARGLLAKMWEFPSVEVDSLQQLTLNHLEKLINTHFGDRKAQQFTKLPVLKHTYSHIALQFLPILLQSERTFSPDGYDYLNLSWVEFANLTQLAIHNAHKKILKHKLFKKWWEE